MDFTVNELSVSVQQEAFEKLLCAIYSKRYKLRRVHELLAITAMAEYYRALPILSRNTGRSNDQQPAFYWFHRVKCSPSLGNCS
jgi:hypothetical protein